MVAAIVATAPAAVGCGHFGVGGRGRERLERSGVTVADVLDGLLLRPTILEYGVHQEQYDALVADLEAEGVAVEIETPAEYRSIPSMELPSPDDVYAVVIVVGTVAGAVLSVVKLAEMVHRRLHGTRRRRTEPRRGKIVLANGDEHEFILDADDE